MLNSAETFLLETIFLSLDALAAKSLRLTILAGAETDATKRAAICAGLLAIDAIAEVKFPGQWHQARRAAA